MAASVTSVTIDAPCKINLALSVGDRRGDGFHDIESVFAALGLCDTLHISTTEDASDELLVGTEGLPPPFDGLLSPSSLPPETNIVSRAGRLFRTETGFDRAVRMRLVKRIPPAAGLGGGSSDAAAVLTAMNRLSGASLGTSKLLEMAASLGSDVPFFVSLAEGCLPGKCAYVSGRGEVVEAIDAPRLAAVIVNPGIASGTKEAFALLDRMRGEGRLAASVGQTKADALSVLAKAPAERSLGDCPLRNDFLAAFLANGGDVYRAMLDDIRRCGALFRGLSGSGSSCFGIFADAAGAGKAAAALRGGWPFVKEAASVNGGNGRP
jgi:4-diphosphocytidyl-2-C-methyl-D-erythritol kinase